MKELEKINKIKWASIWCIFNTWGWPDELEHIKPKGFDELSSNQILPIIRPYMDHINKTLGDRWISREWNKSKMSEQEHNKWWIENHIEKSYTRQ